MLNHYKYDDQNWITEDDHQEEHCSNAYLLLVLLVLGTLFLCELVYALTH